MSTIDHQVIVIFHLKKKALSPIAGNLLCEYRKGHKPINQNIDHSNESKGEMVWKDLKKLYH